MNEFDLFALLRSQWTVEFVDHQPGNTSNGSQRRAEFVTHVGQESTLQFGRLPELLGPVVQLRIQRDDTLIGFGQFVRERANLRLALSQFLLKLGELQAEFSDFRSGRRFIAHMRFTFRY